MVSSKDLQRLGFDYPNLPYLIDDDKKITQTNAILSYISLKAGKKNSLEIVMKKYVQVQIALGTTRDLFDELAALARCQEDFEKAKDEAFSQGN